MRRTLSIFVRLFFGTVVLFQSCADYYGFQRPSVNITISNHTNRKVAISVDNIELMPEESRSFTLINDMLPQSLSYEWGDTVVLVYDDSISVRHISNYDGDTYVFIPATGNILDGNSWRHSGDKSYEYDVPSIDSISY